jgi:hypothetical protein
MITSPLWAQEDLDKVAHDNIPAYFSDIEHVNWLYKKADLDNTKNEDYLIVIYGDDNSAGKCPVVILKETNNGYSKIWETPPVDSPYGTLYSASIELDDLDGNNKPEVFFTIFWPEDRNDLSTYVINWQGEQSTCHGDFVNVMRQDINRDGKKELLQFFSVYNDIDLPDGTRERQYEMPAVIINEFDGATFSEQSIIDFNYNGENLNSSFEVIPTQWRLSWATTAQPDYIKSTLSAIDESHAVTEIDTTSVRLEERVKSARTWVEGDKFFAEFDKQAVMQYLIKTPRLKPLAPGDKIDITVSALLTTGQYVSGTSKVKIIEEPKSIPFDQFSLKHWRIHWEQGKHGKNKFQLSGRIDLPDDYTLDMLQKKGIVTIAIEKKDSAPFSQTATLDFKQHGPIWRYKAPKAQNGTQPLDIEKMLIFWQPEGSEGKPDSQCQGKHKRNGWFMIQGNINISDTDQAALLPKAALTLNIPVKNITTAGSLESSASVDFIVNQNRWFYKSPRPCPGWQDNWWEKVKED